MNRIFAAAFFALALPASAGAQDLGPGETEIRLDTGNIELAVIDGTTISVAPGSHLTITHANGPGDRTQINVLKGELQVSNVFHKHSDILLIRTGDHTFELNRGSALIEHTGAGPQGTLMHGTSLGIQGSDRKLTRPGMRLRKQSRNGSFREERPDAGTMNKTLKKVTGRKAAPKTPGVQKGIKRRKPEKRRQEQRRQDDKRRSSQILQREDLNTLVKKKKRRKAKPPKAAPRPPRPPADGAPPPPPPGPPKMP